MGSTTGIRVVELVLIVNNMTVLLLLYHLKSFTIFKAVRIMLGIIIGCPSVLLCHLNLERVRRGSDVWHAIRRPYCTTVLVPILFLVWTRASCAAATPTMTLHRQGFRTGVASVGQARATELLYELLCAANIVLLLRHLPQFTARITLRKSV